MLEVAGLSVEIAGAPVLRGVSLSVGEGEILAVTGESGSGKSMTALAVMGLLPEGARAAGRIALGDRDLLAASEAEMCALRGAEIGMVFQEPMTALNPVRTIGDQVAETARVHAGASRREARALAREALARAELPPDRCPPSRYPHELSGGQRQRVCIAMAVALRPRLLIADEPTTALDVTTQARILALLRRLVGEEGMGLLLITHDLAVVAGLAHRIAVMREGRVVEHGPAARVLAERRHPYTRALFEASRHVPMRRLSATAPPRSEDDRPPPPSSDRARAPWRAARAPATPDRDGASPAEVTFEGASGPRGRGDLGAASSTGPRAGSTWEAPALVNADAGPPSLSVPTHTASASPGRGNGPGPPRPSDAPAAMSGRNPPARPTEPGPGTASRPLLEVRGLVRAYDLPRRLFEPRRVHHAVGGVSLAVREGESVGLVGESGCGKSTLARAILGLDPVQGGTIQLGGEPMTVRAGHDVRRRIGAVFQDPYGSFNPRHRVARSVAEPFHLMPDAPRGDARRRAVAEALDAVGLPPDAASRHVHAFSGGQRQRLAIARALVIRPALIVLDEAVSALDVRVRARILDLLADLRARHGLAYLFISHDLTVVRAITDRVLVMAAGEIVEEGPTEAVLTRPRHPATRALVEAAPRLPELPTKEPSHA